MDIFAIEYENIKNRMIEIRTSLHSTNAKKNIVIADGDPVLKEDAHEYKNLNRLKEILEDGMRQSTDWEYLELRKDTNLSPLDDRYKGAFKDSTAVLEEEKDIVRTAIKEIETTKSMHKVAASNGVSIDESDVEKYEALLGMVDIIDANFKTEDYFEYMSLREQSGLGVLNNNTYINLMGKESPSGTPYYSFIDNKYRKNPYVHGKKSESKDENLNKPTTEELAVKNDQLVSKVIEEEIILPKPADALESTIEQTSTTIKDSEDLIAPEMTQNINDAIDPLPKSTNYLKESSYPIDQNESVIITENPFKDPLKKEIRKSAIDIDYEEITEPIKAQDDTAPKLETALVPLESAEELEEVVKVTPWQWAKKHKKQILITIGLTAMITSIVVFSTQLIPAVITATKTTKIAAVAEEMIRNSSMWHLASAGEKVALHSANTALSELLSSISGLTSTYNIASGAWTVGTSTLAEFASTAATTAAQAVSKVSLLSNVTVASGLTGLISYGLGKTRSKEYKKIKASIDNLRVACATLPKKDLLITANLISEKILSSEELTERERTVLLKKLQKVAQKIRNLDLQKNNIHGLSAHNKLIQESLYELEEHDDTLSSQGEEYSIITTNIPEQKKI